MISSGVDQQMSDITRHPEMVHVLKVSLKSEIRRIAVTSYVVSHYNVLCEQMVRLFPSLGGRTFILGWKDEDGDEIVMSSDAELAQAVASAQDGVIKIFIRLTDDIGNSNGGCGSASAGMAAPNVPGPHHVNVLCDSCNNEIHGYRYKCLQCKDYDLCHSCNSQDKHPGHDMLKMALPATEKRKWNFLGIRRMWSSMFGYHPFGGHRFSCGHHGKHFGKNASGSGGSSGPEAGSSNFQDKCAETGQDFLQAVGASVANLLDAFGVDVKVLVEPGCEQDHMDSETCNKKPPNTDDAKQQQDSNMDAQTCANTEVRKDTPAAKPVPSTSSQLHTTPTSSGTGSEASNTEAKTAKDVFMEMQANARKMAIMRDDAPCDCEFGNNDKGARPKSVSPNLYPDLSSGHDASVGEAVNALKKQAATVAANIQQYGIQHGPAAAEAIKKGVENLAAFLQLQHKESSPPEGWILLNSEQAEENTIPKAAEAASPAGENVVEMTVDDGPKEGGEAETPMEVVAPSAPKESGATAAPKPAETLDPEIANALETMLSMGYENEGGWLVRLLKAKHGNISEALDSLYK